MGERDLGHGAGKSLFRGRCLFRMRQRSREVFEYCLGKKNGGILAAMVLGEKAGMDPEVKELYQKSGISHLLAIPVCTYL